jgi:hypothetical protein
MKSRGRPRKDDDAILQVIGESVWQMSMMGFPLRSGNGLPGVYESVGQAARTILGKVDHNDLPLGPDRIEQIYEGWRQMETARRKAAKQWPLGRRERYTKQSLLALRPGGTQEEIALLLLKCGGKWPHERISGSGDMELTSRALAELGGPIHLKTQ